ncbi:MAG: winged helix DNA-binding domain-containing protein [Actinomycetota bacterium]|nr:winged helix DNA-binding domain-containing protein [Actinomycetota bacterium]
MALRAQGLLGRTGRPRTVAGVLDQVGALQLDTISVLARSHELVCEARLGAIGRPAIERGCWAQGDGPATTFEYWAHAACILPVTAWPWFAFRRRHHRVADRWHLEAPDDLLASVTKRIADEGPVTASGLGGAKRGGPWWDWSPIKMAVELLLDRGEVICVTRQGWKRVYDLPSRVLPPPMADGPEPDDATCIAALVGAAGAAMGVATRSDLADYYRLRQDQVITALPATGLVPVRVAGWNADAWADPAALHALGRRGRHRTTLLSPFDSLIWDRSRTLRLFGFAHRLEAYTPAPKRVHGYYVMPVLAGGHLIGRVDPGRSGAALVAKRVSVTRPAALPDVADALREAAAWVGASQVAVDVVDPPALKGPLTALLA